MKVLHQILCFFCLMGGVMTAWSVELPQRVLVGYWQNWSPLRLHEVPKNYNVIQLAFATTKTGTDYDMEFNLPTGYSQAQMISDIKDLHAQGRVVILSIGGASDPVFLNDGLALSTFVSSINSILESYQDLIDGIDLDLESTSLHFGEWTLASPSFAQKYMISAVQQIMDAYHQRTGRKLLLTMAPETVYIQGGLSSYQINYLNGGAYLPIIEALKDSLDLIHPQYYNAGGASGGTYANDGKIYYDIGDPDYITALTETLIQGFTILNGKGNFSGIPASKIAVGLLANGCINGTGYVMPDTIVDIVRYLRGEISKPAYFDYTLKKSYPDFRGLMVWSINHDEDLCDGQWSFSQVGGSLLGNSTILNPVKNQKNLQIPESKQFDLLGRLRTRKQL